MSETPKVLPTATKNFGAFCDALDALIERWHDDGNGEISYAEIIGALEFLKLKLAQRAVRIYRGEEQP